MNRRYIVVLVLALVAAAAVIGVQAIDQQEYKKYTVTGLDDDGPRCQHYYESCKCIGTLVVMESYPPQYNCKGINFCDPLNESVCK